MKACWSHDANNRPTIEDTKKNMMAKLVHHSLIGCNSSFTHWFGHMGLFAYNLWNQVWSWINHWWLARISSGAWLEYPLVLQSSFHLQLLHQNCLDNARTHFKNWANWRSQLKPIEAHWNPLKPIEANWSPFQKLSQFPCCFHDYTGTRAWLSRILASVAEQCVRKAQLLRFLWQQVVQLC